jgi:hypothetical protein
MTRPAEMVLCRRLLCSRRARDPGVADGSAVSGLVQRGRRVPEDGPHVSARATRTSVALWASRRMRGAPSRAPRSSRRTRSLSRGLGRTPREVRDDRATLHDVRLRLRTASLRMRGASPGMGSASSGTGGASPGTGCASHGTGSASRGMGSASPGTGSASHGTGSASHGTGSAWHGTGRASRGAGSASPGTGTASHGTGGACLPWRSASHRSIWASLPTRREAIRTTNRASTFASGIARKRWGVAPKG